MKEKVSAVATVLGIFVIGCLTGGYMLWMSLRLDGLTNEFVAFKKDVQQFAKQVNDEFKKRPVPGSKK